MSQDPNQPAQPVDPNAAPNPGAVQTGSDLAVQHGTASPYVAAGLGTPLEVEVFNSLQNGYLGPLQGDTQPATPQLNDPTLQAVADRLASLQETHPVLSGQQPPNTDSVIARQTSNLSAMQIASQVGQQTWQQSVVQPFQDFVKTWQTDWHAGLMETLGGAALIGGLVGLEALTGGAATPFIFAVSAMLVAPSMVQAWGDEIHNPTDANLVRALVSTSSGLLTVGVPVKWAQGMMVSRASLAFALRSKTEQTAVEALVPKLLSGHPEWRNLINLSQPIEQQLSVLADTAATLKAQFKDVGMSLQDKSIGDLLARTKALEGLRKAYVSTTDPLARQALKLRMEAFSKSDVMPLRMEVASHYLFLESSKFKHIPLNPTEATAVLDKNLQFKASQEGQAIMGYIRQLGYGHPGLTSDQLSGASIVEHAARDLAAGGSQYLIAKMHFHHDQLVKVLGLSEDDIRKIEIGMEDPAAWEKLNGKEQLYGQYRSMMHGAMTSAELRWGTIPLAVAGYLPRMFTGAEDVAHTNGVRNIFAALHGTLMSRSRVYQSVFDIATGDISYAERSRQSILDEEEAIAGRYRKDQPKVDYFAANGPDVEAARGTASGYLRHISRYKNLGQTDKAAKEYAKLQLLYTDATLKHPMHGELTQMAPKEFERLKGISPLQRKLVTGTDLFRASTASFVYRMEEASVRAAMEAHANLNLTWLKKEFLKRPLGKYGISLQTPEFKAAHPEGLPDFMPASAFASGADATKGYKQVARAIGSPGDLHYRPALLARDDIADEYLKALEGATTGSEVFSGLSGALYKTLHVSKRFIMATPFWHAMNVSGRAIAFVLDDPVGAKTALSTVWGKGEFLLNPEERAIVEARASQAGLVHANKFEVVNQQHRVLKNQDGQSTWPQTLRTLGGPVSHAYQDMLEGGFWKMVDDFQLAAFQLAEHKLSLKLPNEPAAEISRLAAEYANTLAGMVNPLYMNKVYRHARNMIWFAPSYWATFTRTLVSLPFSDRMSNFLAKYRGGEFVRFGAVPLKAVSQTGRRELARMQRSWLLTYLATSVAAADMMNVMLGGRHIWENDPGHQFDINVDHFAAWSKNLPVVGGLSPGGPVTKPSGQVQHTYISSIPFFRQGADVMNALGMGHDWGLAHNFGDQTWQQANAIQKGLMLGGNLLDGIRRQGAGKLSGPLQAGYGLVTGEELSARLGQGVQSQIKGPVGNLAALLSLIPGGTTQERFWSQDASAAERGGQPPPTILGGLPASMPAALIQQFTGFPSMHHIGPEQPPVDDSKMKNWYDQRNQLHDALSSASKQMFTGQMTPLGYERKRQQLLDRLIQLDSDTFGSNSAAAPLANARAELASQLGLDNLGLSDSAWYARYQNFQSGWDQILQSASPASRTAWWETEHSQFTDADYLAWEARQIKQAVASAVDGQGGAHIRAYENQIASLYSLPLTQVERQKIEQADPYYYAYRQIITAMSRSSALGAFVNAFTSPNSETFIMPTGLSLEEQQQLASLAPATASLITPEVAAELAAQAKVLANDPAVAASGGKATASPAFGQELAALAQKAQGG